MLHCITVASSDSISTEHSHESIITVVRVSLNLDNPDQIQDPVFALLGDAAAAAGAGNINVQTYYDSSSAEASIKNLFSGPLVSSASCC